jgi:hypothetical protein
LPILLQAAQYPLTIRWNFRTASAIVLEAGGAREIPLDGEGMMTLNSSDGDHLRLKQLRTARAVSPSSFQLLQNYPNPFNPSTRIEFQIGELSHGGGAVKEYWVTLILYDIGGEEVATLVEENRGPGLYAETWDATNIASGIYFARLTVSSGSGTAGGNGTLFSSTRKLLLVR